MNGILRFTGLLIAATSVALAQDADRQAKQAELDAACEAARQEKLIAVRAEFVEECVEKQQRRDRAACERFYANYGESSGGNQVPLFYDLPACVRADEYRRSYRNPER